MTRMTGPHRLGWDEPAPADLFDRLDPEVRAVSSCETPYPLPFDLATEAEVILQSLPDREETVVQVRRLLGKVYAKGHEAGHTLAVFEATYDKQVQ